MARKKRPDFFVENVVINGEFIVYMYDTEGLPLETQIMIAEEKNLLIDWPGVTAGGLNRGWNQERWIRRCWHLYQDLYLPYIYERFGTTERSIEGIKKSQERFYKLLNDNVL